MGCVASAASPWQIASRAPRRQWWSGRQAPTNAGKNTRTRPLPNDAIHFALWGGRHHKGPATTRPYIFRSLTEQGAREIRMNATVATLCLILFSSLGSWHLVSLLCYIAQILACCCDKSTRFMRTSAVGYAVSVPNLSFPPSSPFDLLLIFYSGLPEFI